MKLRHFENVFEPQFDSKGTACNDDLVLLFNTSEDIRDEQKIKRLKYL